MKVTALIENRPSSAYPNLAAEWGLSLHLTFNDYHILFDTGSSGAFLNNAHNLSIDLSAVDAAVLSHHHFDHGGGLRRFLDANASSIVHLAKAPDGECFTKLFILVKKYIGLDKTLITDYPDRFKIVNQSCEILPDVFVFPTITGSHPKPHGNKSLFVKRNGKFIPDDFSHELVLAIKENNSLIIFTGCSHNGILNMIDTVTREFKGVPIKAVVGGFHLVASPPFNAMAGSKRDVEELAHSILEYPVKEIYTGHCTGNKAFAILKGVMGERISEMVTGTSFEV